MDFRSVIRACSNELVAVAVELAIDDLLSKDALLFDNAGTERPIAHRLALHLTPWFEGYDVDCDYGRMGADSKRLDVDDFGQIYPDIIVHRRGIKFNLLAVEVKVSSNRETKVRDCRKLHRLRTDPRFEYEHALFIRFGVGRHQQDQVTECEWV